MAKPKRDATIGLNGALAAELRGELAARSMTREDLAAAADIPLDSMKNYLSASPSRARVMDLDVVAKIAAALGISPRDLIAKAEARLSSPLVRRGDSVELRGRESRGA